MSYRRTEPGERALAVEPLPLSAVPGHFPGFPGGLPGPVSRAPGPIGPTMPTSIFPTHTTVGDVVTITGPFGTLVQGQVRVKFQGTSWLSPQIIGPATASVVVPEGAENGLCEVEINGRRVYGTNCIIDKGRDIVGRPSHKGRDVRAWSHEAQLLGIGEVGELALFGSIGVMAYGWFAGNPTLRNVGVVSTLALFLLRGIGD